jgi:hypothetical protein
MPVTLPLAMGGRATLLAALALLLTAVPAGAAPQDVAATHAFIQANYALARASVARIGPAQAKIERFNGKLAGECPRVGSGSPQDEESQPVAHLVAIALWSISYGTNAGPIRTFAQAVKHLRWGNHGITAIAQGYAKGLRDMATIPLPDLCGVVAAWKATGYKVVPAAALDLVRRVEAIETKPIPPSLLAPYERGSDAGVLAATLRLESTLEEKEIRLGLDDTFQVLQTLELNE